MNNPLQEITDGFSVDGGNVLHWSSKALLGLEAMQKVGLREAEWGLKPREGGGFEMWISLGCPAFTEHSFHGDLVLGKVGVVYV